MSAYYNEFDPFAAAWLRELIKAGLIADGEVDERSIADVQPDDVRGFTQCHFFAGIGGWSYALRLAGWSDRRSVWTGSCPCQPFSSASRGAAKRLRDHRHLWPWFYRLIAANSPRVVFGEQVAQAGDWLDEICDDMEALGYETGAAVLPAVAVGADHARARIYFASHAHGHRQSGRAIHAKASGVPGCGSQSSSVVSPHGLPADVDLLRGFGNAIVPQVAQAFIEAYMDASATPVDAASDEPRTEA